MKRLKNCNLLILSIALFISGCSSVAQSKGNEKLQIDLKEYSIGSGEIRLNASDNPLKLTIKNKGMTAHNFVIQELGMDSGIITPGQSVTLEINAQDAALLQAKCTLPGHTEAGMISQVIISK